MAVKKVLAGCLVKDARRLPRRAQVSGLQVAPLDDRYLEVWGVLG